MFDTLIFITQGSPYDFKARMRNCRFELLLLSLTMSQYFLTLQVEGNYEYAALKKKEDS